MKINGQYPKLPVQEKNTSAASGKDKADGRREVGIKSGSDSISGMSLTTKRMREKLDAEPDVNQEKINALRAKIKKGEYQVDMDKLASRILEDSILEDN